jgi:hypothetical protein
MSVAARAANVIERDADGRIRITTLEFQIHKLSSRSLDPVVDYRSRFGEGFRRGRARCCCRQPQSIFVIYRYDETGLASEIETVKIISFRFENHRLGFPIASLHSRDPSTAAAVAAVAVPVVAVVASELLRLLRKNVHAWSGSSWSTLVIIVAVAA